MGSMTTATSAPVVGMILQTSFVYTPQQKKSLQTKSHLRNCLSISSSAAAALIQASPLHLKAISNPHSNNNNVLWGLGVRRSVATSAVRHLVGSVTRTEGLRFAVVVARFNEVVTKRLLEGALETFMRYAVKEEDVDVIWVPGSFEIPAVAERLGKLKKYHAILCIGAVIRGDTSHYDAVANSAASGVLSAGLSSGVPCVFGVLTCEDMDQALNRAGGKAGNKGAETALTAIEMASLFEHHLSIN